MGETAQLTKKISISAMHELRNDGLTPEENLKIFGKCYRMHGHDYRLEVTVEGPIDPDTGLCCDRDLFFDILETEIRMRFDKTHLNDFFKSTSGEDLAREFYQILAEKLRPLSLVKVRLQETPKNFFSFGPGVDSNPVLLS